jgi:1-acyl-sn-glycerol-3-phosphate acyltransferase
MLQRFFRLLYGLYATLALALVIVPLCLLIIVGPTLAIRRATGRFGVKLAMLVIGQPLNVRGLEHLPAGPAVCVANHASYVDGLVLTAALPARFTFLVQSGAAAWPLAGWTIKRMGVSFVNRASARDAALATRELLRRIKDGESFTIFAEGTFKQPAGLLAFHSGAFVIATKAQVPVVPAVICGTRRLFGEGMWLPAFSRLSITVLPAIAPQGDGREAANTLRDAARAAILARCGEPDAAHPVPEPHSSPD